MSLSGLIDHFKIPGFSFGVVINKVLGMSVYTCQSILYLYSILLLQMVVPPSFFPRGDWLEQNDLDYQHLGHNPQTIRKYVVLSVSVSLVFYCVFSIAYNF